MINKVAAAGLRLQPVILRTALQYHKGLSDKFSCHIYLKREDQQTVRSYKVREAFNKIISLPTAALERGVTCASAGNHAQGVAYCCKYLNIRGTIFMPVNTPSQKIKRVTDIGGDQITITLVGDAYDEAADAARKFCEEHNSNMVHPFDDEKVIEGQATVAMEILETLSQVDYLFMPVGGGGLAAGVGKYIKERKQKTILVGVEPAGAASMTAAFAAGEPVALKKIDPFVDGAAVQKVGRITYNICKETLDQLHTVPEGKVCASLLSLYDEDGIVAEPAGVLSIAALDDYADQLIGKTVVCILSGGNNDSNRMEEIKKLADAWEGLQHYLVIRFHHQPDGLKEFFTHILGPEDYVNRIEYVRRDHGRSTYALLGLRSRNEKGFRALTERLRENKTEFREVQKKDFLFKYWV